ncbi:hypothetical protein L3C95_26225 [Chitinophaga filiformis]|uniref:hypothetical protein n=1 Tax=Chitinophaga filiformis TaxID=104663 RepID=UPI001F487E8D|nr:hypothetical protein [Chitinophaga filiformis]MCF6406420.1 hypothetical protein [Chitinophaga filiformis]
MGCKQNAKPLLDAEMKKGAMQEKEVNNITVAVAYMPSCRQHADASQSGAAGGEEMTFRVNVHSRDNSRPLHVSEKDNYSYGIDSLFSLVINTDTVPALYAHKVANGNLGGIEYLVSFRKDQVERTSSLALLFRDWLFTSTLLRFNYNRNLLDKVDSLSCSI